MTENIDYIRQKRMNCSSAVLQMAAARMGKSQDEIYRIFAANRSLSLYSPGDVCKFIRLAGFNALLLECPSYEQLSDRWQGKPAIAISFLLPTGHYFLVEDLLPENKMLVSDPLGCYPYGKGDRSGDKQIYDFKIATANHIGMPYWFVLIDDFNNELDPLSCGYAVSDIVFKNKTLIIRNGTIDYLSREANTVLNLNHWQGWKLETIKALDNLCQSHNIRFRNIVDAQIANLIIKTFVAKWRRLNSMLVK